MIIIDNEPKILKHRPLVGPDAQPSYEGPPLQKRAGHFKLKD